MRVGASSIFNKLVSIKKNEGEVIWLFASRGAHWDFRWVLIRTELQIKKRVMFVEGYREWMRKDHQMLKLDERVTPDLRDRAKVS